MRKRLRKKLAQKISYTETHISLGHLADGGVETLTIEEFKRRMNNGKE